MSEFKKLLNDPYQYANGLSVDKLVELLEKLSVSYYTAKPVVPDNVYDMIRGILEEKDPGNEFLKKVGYEIVGDGKKVVLPHKLYSLNKVKNVEGWIKKYEGPYALSDKLDGISGLLYKNGKIIKLYTRGDSATGRDISQLIKLLFRGYDFNKLPEKCAIRGEIVISRENYEIAKKVKTGKAYTDHRSCIAGLVNSKTMTDEKEGLAKLTDFVAYELIDPRHKQDTQFKMLEGYDLNVVSHKIVNVINHEVLSEYLTARRIESAYYVDGIVAGDCSVVYPLAEDGNPDYAFAFKLVFNDQIVETVVKFIDWEVSKDDYIKPTVVLEPVKINGVTINRATGYNAKYIVSNKIGPGTVVKLIRSGDVIPKIIEVVSGQVEKPSMPSIKYEWNDTQVDLIAIGMDDATKKEIAVKKITFFFTTMKIAFIGEGVVTKLVGAGYDSVEKILAGDVDKVSKIDGLGKNGVSKIYESIRVGFEVADLGTLMAASGIFGRGLGREKFVDIINAIPNIMSAVIDGDLNEKVNGLEGFSGITTKKFIDGLEKFKQFFERLRKIDGIDVAHMLVVKKKDVGTLFKGQIFALTGQRNKEIEQFILNNGGEIKGSVTKNTVMLLCDNTNDLTSNKFIAAKKWEIPIVIYADFIKKYMVK